MSINEEWDENGFNEKGLHIKTGTQYDDKGFDKDGYNKWGYNKDALDREGYDRRGFNKYGIHKITKTKYDENGLNIYGLDKDSYKSILNYDRGSYNEKYKRYTMNLEDLTNDEFDIQGIHKVTGSRYDEDGYDLERI